MTYVTSVERHGIALGETRGTARLLRGQLERRFGTLPPEVITRLEAADVERLMVWGERVIDAPTLDAVLADGH